MTSFPNYFYNFDFPWKNVIASTISNGWKSINLHLKGIVEVLSCWALSILNYFTLTITNSFHCVTKFGWTRKWTRYLEYRWNKSLRMWHTYSFLKILGPNILNGDDIFSLPGSLNSLCILQLPSLWKITNDFGLKKRQYRKEVTKHTKFRKK